MYNYFLTRRKDVYNTTKKVLGFYACSKELTQLKQINLWLTEVDSYSLETSIKDLDYSFKNFFRHIKTGEAIGFPQFKSKRSSRKSYRTRNLAKDNNIRFEGRNIRLPKLGLVKCRVSKEVKGGILWGILITWVLGIFAQLTGWYVVDPEAGVYSVLPTITSAADFLPSFSSLADTAFKFDFGFVAGHFAEFAVIVFAFLFVDLFDTVGTLIGVAAKGNLLDKEGKLPRVGKALMSDALGTVVGACLGTSTVTSYVESSAGVAEGGRTGLTAATTGVLFLLSMFLWPIFGAIPSFATAPALVVVGLFMMSSVLKVKFEGDTADVLGAFVAIIMMPFTYSIANGIMFGILTWMILKILRGKFKEIHPVMWIVFALFVLRIVTLVMA